MRHRWGWIPVVSIMMVFGCGPEPEPSDGGVLGADGAADTGGMCCPVGLVSYCGCHYTGGYAPSMGSCVRECDGADYTTETDEHGCQRLVAHASCLTPDAGPPPIDGGICCPIPSPIVCGCQFIGGYATSASECRQECDGGDYTTETDPYGCALLVSHGSCIGIDGGASDAGMADDAGDADVLTRR